MTATKHPGDEPRISELLAAAAAIVIEDDVADLDVRAAARIDRDRLDRSHHTEAVEIAAHDLLVEAVVENDDQLVLGVCRDPAKSQDGELILAVAGPAVSAEQALFAVTHTSGSVLAAIPANEDPDLAGGLLLDAVPARAYTIHVDPTTVDPVHRPPPPSPGG